MTRDIEVLMNWLQVVLVITAICVTSVPILYSFSPWRTTSLGRWFMRQAIAFAAAFDITTIFSIWQPTGMDILVWFWINVIVMLSVATSTAGVAIWIVRSNYMRR